MKEIVERIERYLKEYELVLLFGEEKEFAEEWLGYVAESIKFKAATKKILILSDMDILHKPRCDYAYRRINRDEKEALEHLHSIYDFSDRFLVVSDRRQYGGLLNYIKTGIITLEEMLQILFM